MKRIACKLTRHFSCRKSRHSILWVLALCWTVASQPASLLAAESETVVAKRTAAHTLELSTSAERIRKVSQKVYRLLVDIEGGIKGGTAFLVSGSRVVATNYHVVDGGTAFWLGYIDATGLAKKMPMRLIAIYPQKDLALLEALDELPGQPLCLTTQPPLPASDLYAIGFPAAADPQGMQPWNGNEDETFFLPSVLKGTISRILTNRWLTSQLQHQTPIVPGYSGGPLVDAEGTVVGISSSIHKEANGISYGVLAADLIELADACSLPVEGNLPVPRSPARRPVSSTPAPPIERTNTHSSIQPRPAFSATDIAALKRAENLMQNGVINAAQMICQHLATTTRSPEAFRCLGQTYDPEVLRGLGAIGISGDRNLALFYYKQADSALLVPQEMPVPQKIDSNLAPPKAGTCNNSICKLVLRVNGPVVACDNVQKN